MDLEIIEEKIGEVRILQSPILQPASFIVPGTTPVQIQGEKIHSLFQAFNEPLFSAWFNSYACSAPTVLRARGAMPVLELRISLSKAITGTWDKIEEPALEPHFFNIHYTPFVSTRAVFEPGNYESFDIHLTTELLESMGIESAELDKFIARVHAGRPAQLFYRPMPCPPSILDAIFYLKHINLREDARKGVMDCRAREIIYLALSQLNPPEGRKEKYISASYREQLMAARKLIEDNLYEYPQTPTILQHTGLNETKLNRGFMALFGTTPHGYHIQLKMRRAKKLLLESDESIKFIAYELGYNQESNFTREFKKRCGVKPSEFRAQKG